MTNWKDINDMGNFRTRYAKEHGVKTHVGEFKKRGYEVRENGSDFYEVFDEPVPPEQMKSGELWSGYSKDHPVFTAICVDWKDSTWVIRFHIDYFNWDEMDGDNWEQADIVAFGRAG